MSTGLGVAIVLVVVAGILIVLGLVGLVRPARYQSMMRRASSAGPITGLRVISSVEVVVGVVLVAVVVMLRLTGRWG